jgi:hypothetical protein
MQDFYAFERFLKANCVYKKTNWTILKKFRKNYPFLLSKRSHQDPVQLLRIRIRLSKKIRVWSQR